MPSNEASTTTADLSGLIERVTFHSEETGFSVLRIKVKGQRDLVTVVGSLPAVQAGEWLVARGEWTQDRDHGRQFKAGQLRCLPPTSKEGIEKYLGSGLIKGIGPVYAGKMVARFGETIFDIIDQSSARLEEIEGIGPARRRQIKAAWTEQKAVREIMMFLHSHGVSTSRSLRIFKTYGDAAVEKVKANPYALADDIQGIGFQSADQIARNLGIAADSRIRVCAGLRHLLLAATEEGHCALPRELLIEQGMKLLAGEHEKIPNSPGTPGSPAMTETALTEVLDRMLRDREAVIESIDGRLLVFHPALQTAEAGIAQKIRRLSAQPSRYPAIDMDKAIVWSQAKTGKELSPSQRQALSTVLAHRLVIVTGGPGVGKTTLIHSLLLILKAKRLRCLLCAPTGRAAKRLAEVTGFEAKTIHRLLEYQPAKGEFSRNETRPLESDLLIVDEVSMVDVPLMYKLLKAVPGDGSLVLVGDVDQLPSVGPGMVLRHLIESGVTSVVRLTEIFRQAAGSRVIQIAHGINQGWIPEPSPKNIDSDFYFVERDEPEKILATVIHLVQERIPRRFRCDAVRDIQVLCPMNRGSLGTRELNARLQAALNPPRTADPVVDRFGWQFRIRDKVIQTQNNYDKDVYNGDIGWVQRIDPVDLTLTIEFDGRDVVYDFGDLDEIQPAYAITIHKAQGSEFPVVVIPLAMQHYMMLQRNLIYTGITRGKKLVVVVGQKKALAAAVRNARSEQRFSGLLARLKA